MKVNEQLLEDITLKHVKYLNDLSKLEDKNGKYRTDVVNVEGDVYLIAKKFQKIPVKFGWVNGYFTCASNRLTSLKNAPRKVGQGFDCFDNHLTSLEDAPQEVGAHIQCNKNQISSLEGIHKIIKKINGQFNCRYNPIKSGGIGLLLIEGITEIRSELPAFEIINKYLGQGKKGLLACQEELIERGLEEYAKL